NYKILVEDGELKGERKETSKPRSFYATKSLSHTQEEDIVHRLETEETAKANADAGRLVDEEDREEGRVSKDIFLQYFKSLGGVKVCVLLVAAQSLWQAFKISSDLWLSHWTSQHLGEGDQDQTLYNMKVYALLGGGSALMVLTCTITIATFGLKAARHLFDSMTGSLLNAPLRFFDTTPIGRIVNRYGDDIALVDFSLAISYGWFVATLALTVFQLAAAVYMVSFLGLLIVPLAYMYVQVARYYLTPSREVSRLWKVAGSPVLSHITQSEAGVSVIRAFGSEYVDRAVSENFRAIDLCNVVWFAQTAVSQWFQVRIQLIGSSVVIVLVSGLVCFRAYLSPGLIGLAFTYALTVDVGLAKLVGSWTWVEICMVGPERILEYANIPAEGSEKVLVIEPPAQWPHNGSIQFQDVVFSYKEGAP
ncbi:Abc transporter c family member 5, partial [Globisporangium polare]